MQIGNPSHTKGKSEKRTFVGSENEPRIQIEQQPIPISMPNQMRERERERERRRRRSRSASITKTIQQLHDCDLHHCLDYRNPIFPPWHLLAVRIIEGSAAEADCDRLFTSIISLTKKKGRRRFFPLSLFFYLNFFFFFLFVDTETQMQKTKEQRV
jgi:hypothetical protein